MIKNFKFTFILPFTAFATFISASISSYANWQNADSGELIVAMNEDSDWRFTYEQTLQKLVNKIELLEHEVTILKNEKELMLHKDKSPNQKNNNDEAEVTEEESIFDLPNKTTNNANEKEKKATPKVTEGASPSEKKAYDTALIMLKDKKYSDAEGKFADFIKKNPKSPLQSNAYFWYAETFFRRHMYDKAAINFLKGYKDFPKGEKAADSLLKLALSLGEIKKKPEACAMLKKLDKEFPRRGLSSVKRAEDAAVKFGCKYK